MLRNIFCLLPRNQQLEFVRRRKGGTNTGMQRKKSPGGLLWTPPARRVWRWCGPFFRRSDHGRGWHGREVAVGPLALGKHKVVSGVYWNRHMIVGNIHLDITTTSLYCTMNNYFAFSSGFGSPFPLSSFFVFLSFRLFHFHYYFLFYCLWFLFRFVFFCYSLFQCAGI